MCTSALWTKVYHWGLFWKGCIGRFCMPKDGKDETVLWLEVFFIFYRLSILWVETPCPLWPTTHQPTQSHPSTEATLSRARRGCPGTRFPAFGLCALFHALFPPITWLVTLPSMPWAHLSEMGSIWEPVWAFNVVVVPSPTPQRHYELIDGATGIEVL